MNHTFNIQLFAENLNTTATMSQEMKTFYEKRLIDQAEPRLVHDQFADYYPVPQNGGKTIEFRKYDSLPKASTPLTEGVTPNGQTLNVTTITSDLHQYGGWTPSPIWIAWRPLSITRSVPCSLSSRARRIPTTSRGRI